jgi:YbgC/YbaW family acyl-CoA thioester hydrolase
MIIKRKIMWGDLDSLGIVFYPRYYEWMDGCGHLFFESLGFNINDLWQERQIQFGLVETSCRYFSPGRYHDEIEIHVRVTDLAEKTVGLTYEIKRAAEGSRMVEGREKRICMDVSDPARIRARPIPEDIYACLEASQKPL